MRFAVPLVALPLILGSVAFAQTPGQPSQAPAPTRAAPSGTAAQPVDPAAVDALRRMGAYLQTLRTFEVRSTGSNDYVLDNGQKVQFAQAVTFKVRRPNAFRIAFASDRKTRDYFYDGRSLTVFAPRMKYYAQVEAPPTIGEVFDLVAERYDINVPLEDLFVWGTPQARFNEIKAAMHVGYARLEDAECDHYAYRQGDIDWQVWIERGARPLPRKLVITTRTDQAQPEWAAVFDWSLNPHFAADTFTFRAPSGAQRIPLVANTDG
jgi:hypothetical protein